MLPQKRVVVRLVIVRRAGVAPLHAILVPLHRAAVAQDVLHGVAALVPSEELALPDDRPRPDGVTAVL